MRPKFVLALLLFALLVLGVSLFLKQRLDNQPAPSSNAGPAVSIPSAPPTAPIGRPSYSPAVSSSAANTVTPEQRQENIDAETDRLQQWSMNDDPDSLSNILADLTNPEKEIREAAIEAAKQFGSSDAVPALKKAAANTDDIKEKIAFLDAADFLSLPSANLSAPPATPKTPEQIQADDQKRAQRRAREEARIKAEMQENTSNSDAQSTPDQNPPPAPDN